MKASELRTKTSEELEAMLKDLKSELFNLRFQHAINQLENPHKIADTKKDIARVMTIIAEKKAYGGKSKWKNVLLEKPELVAL